MALGACGVTVVGGDGTSVGAGGGGGSSAGGPSLAELGCVSGALETFVPARYPAPTLASDATHVYWADHYFASEADYFINAYSHRLIRTSKADGTEEVLENSFGPISQVEVDDTHVYYVVLPFGVGFQLMALPKSGAGPAVSLYHHGMQLWFTAADPDRIYVWQVDDGFGSAYAVNKSDGASSQLLPQANVGFNIVSQDETHLYWYWHYNDDKRIVRLAKQGGQPETLAEVSSDIDWVGRVLVDAENVYWATSTQEGSTSEPGSIVRSRFHRAPKAGGAAVVLAEVEGPVPLLLQTDMAMDDRCLYWTEEARQTDPQTGANVGALRAMRKSDGVVSASVRTVPASGPLIVDESGLYLAAPAATMPPPSVSNPPALMGAVQRIAR
jgi:hypothetical protein